MTIRQKITQGLQQALDTVLPPRCIVTGDMVDRQGMLTPAAWRALNFIERPFCISCGIPFSYDRGDESNGAPLHCADCLDHPPPYSKARAALRYDEASRDLILGFKHADKTHAVLAFIPWMRRAGTEILGQTDLLIPVPLHSWRLLRRRYNQAALIARALSKETGLPHCPDMLVRTRATPSQGHLGAKERRRNVKKAFALNPVYVERIKGLNVTIIDDVLTTGATVSECARALKKAGAREVNVLTLARTVKPGADF